MAAANVAEVDLAVVGAGLSGCSLIGRFHQLQSNLNIALIEAGRGPGAELLVVAGETKAAGCSTMEHLALLSKTLHPRG